MVDDLVPDIYSFVEVRGCSIFDFMLFIGPILKMHEIVIQSVCGVLGLQQVVS